MTRRPRYTTRIDGLLVVDKPLHLSSADVVRQVRFAAGNCKTGHAGTLDPLATGVVICCLGQATKTVDQLMGMTKVYQAGVDFSAFTTTDDREGQRQEIATADPPTREQLLEKLPPFVGSIAQRPPAYSAIHVGGQRAYKLARRDQPVDLPVRTVRIDAIDLLDYAWPIATLRITCGKGTYIRALARDLGAALGVGGHLASLRRTAVGPYTVEQAWQLDRVEQGVTQSDLLLAPSATSPGVQLDPHPAANR